MGCDGVVDELLPADVGSCFQQRGLDWRLVWTGCARRIRTWRLPPHWSPGDWSDEVFAQGLWAAWQALGDFDATRGVPLNAFVRQRILTSVLTRYRREWAYAIHCGTDVETRGTAGQAGDPLLAAEAKNALEDAVATLPKPERSLITSLFYDGVTENQVADSLGISQPAVNKRKRKILDKLRGSLAGVGEELQTVGYKTRSARII
jgi:RNA polymerase sigma factor (sigma-70 family)